MATEVVSIIDPDAGSGYDYDSLYDWEAAEQGDLTGERDEIAVAKCRCTGGTADDETVVIDGYTTSPTQYIKIWTDEAESYRHNGKWQTGNKYRIDTRGGSSSLQISDPYVKIIGLQIASDYTNVNILAANCFVDSCIFISTYRNGFAFGSGSGGGVCINSLAYNCGYSGFVLSVSGTLYAYNCTAVDCTRHGFIAQFSTANLKNCLSYTCGNGSTYFDFYEDSGTSATLNCSYCASLDATADDQGGSGNVIEISDPFTDYAGDDFSLAADASIIGDGTNLYNDATYAFQDDILGTDRGGSGASWDIGAFEYVAAGGETYSETVTDGFKSGESLARISTFRNVITDGFSGAESMARRADLDLLSSDGAKVGEVLVRILTLGQTASDGIILSEQLINSSSLSLTATDGAALSDSAARRLDLSATIADGCKLSEVLATVLLLSAAVADGAKFSETITTDLSGILEEIISDGFNGSDSTSSLAQFIRAVADQFNLSEAIATALSSARALTDGIVKSDSAAAAGTFPRSASDAIVLTDATAGEILAGIIQAIATDGFKFSETTATVAQFDITVTDGAKFSETIATIMSMLSAIADGLNLGDAATITTETVLASGRVTITFTGRAGGKIVFTVRKPSITFTVN